MSWLFSRALVEEYSPANSSTTEPSAPLNVMPTQHPFWRNDKTTEPSQFSRFGPTCAVLTEDRGAELLIAYLEASRARTSAQPGPDLESTVRVLDSGASLPAWFAKFDPAAFAWRTAQCSLLGGSELFLETWPRSGLMLDGMCYPQPSMARITYGSGSGLLPTLTVHGNYNRPGASKTSGMGLASAIRLMPTLCARDYRYPGKSRMERTGGKQGEVLPQIVGGPLNPDWCEWYMGFPIGWTAFEPLEMPKFREWQQQHGRCLETKP